MYRIIAYTNEIVQNWNKFVRNIIICDADKNILTRNDLIMSYQTIVDDYLSIVINNSEEYIINDIVNYVDNQYKFKGFNVRFQAIHGGKITTPMFVLDDTDRYTKLKYHDVVSEMIKDAKSASIGTRSNKWKKYFDWCKILVR